jgi:hypothetical protein
MNIIENMFRAFMFDKRQFVYLHPMDLITAGSIHVVHLFGVRHILGTPLGQ